MGLAAAVVGAGALGAAGAIGSSVIASDAQTSAAKKAINEQNKMFDVTQRNLQPYNQAGQAAFGTLNKLLTPGSSASTLSSLPGYQWQLGQGLQSVQSGAAARGLGTSGAAIRGAADYVNGLTSTNYNNYVNQLLSAAGLGENAAAGVGNAATATGQGIASNLTGIGNAQAGAAIASGNAISGAANNISGLYLTNALLQSQGGKGLFGGGGGIYAMDANDAANYGSNMIANNGYGGAMLPGF